MSTLSPPLFLLFFFFFLRFTGLIIATAQSSPHPDYGDCPPPPPPAHPLCPPPPYPHPNPPYLPPPTPDKPPQPSPPTPSIPSTPPAPSIPSNPPTPSIPSPPSVPSPPSQGFENERIKKAYLAIQKFKTKIKYDPFNIVKSWKGPNVCNYKGFRCAVRPDVKKRAVAVADFNGYNFGGGDDLQLPGFLDELTDLTLFHANSNNFTGSIPAHLGSRIRFFYEIDLSNNKYVGKFPKHILSAKNASYIDIRYNSFSGGLPAEVFNHDTDVLFLNNNGFSGPLPDNIGDSSAMYLTFANNRFSGQIPRSIGRCENLLEVLLLNNRFSGCLPTEIGNLTKVRIFDAGKNKLTGPIPHSFACLPEMRDLNLARNKLYGAVPESVCQLPKLTNLSLSSNYFTQVGPACRKLIDKKVLDVKDNCILDLPGQKSAEECGKFFSGRTNCPNVKTLMSYVPCKKGENSDRRLTEVDEEESVPAPASFAYLALRPHKLR
ncbi:Uncharacterized protein At4g06744 [Linum grandiflorum]